MKRKDMEYDVTMQERCLFLLQGIVLCVLVNYLFYRSILVLILMMPLPFFWFAFCRKERMKRRKKELNYQFRDALNMLSVSLRAGYSIENGLIEVEKDMRRLNGSGSEIVRELSYINSQIKVCVSAEELLMDFGQRSGVEDIRNFASVFCVARKMGGNFVEIVGDCAKQISEKIETDRSIELAVAAKKFEHKIMSAMPVCIILYLQVTSPGFFEDLYGTLFGTCFMSVCLMVYGIACLMGHRIVSIEV